MVLPLEGVFPSTIERAVEQRVKQNSRLERFPGGTRQGHLKVLLANFVERLGIGSVWRIEIASNIITFMKENM
jgi:hypothetical protein